MTAVLSFLCGVLVMAAVFLAAGMSAQRKVIEFQAKQIKALRIAADVGSAVQARAAGQPSLY